MKKVRLSSICILLSLILIFSSVSPAFAAAPALPSKNSCERHIVCTSLSDSAKNYYTGIYTYNNLSSLKGADDISDSYKACQNNALYDTLKALMSSTHAYYTTYSGSKAGSLAYYWQSTDAVGTDSGYVMFYSDLPGSDGSVSMNREHVWPKSRASYQTEYGGADLHHLRPSAESVNKVKSDHTFGYVNKSYSENVDTGIINGEELYWANIYADLFECKDDVKGDVARILLYVYCRWGQPNLFSYVKKDKLPAFDSDDVSNSGKAVIENLDTLLEWCEDDPVDTWEMKRNDLIQQIQGNRNVFIDYPELAWQMFSLDIPAGLTTPSRKGCEHNWQITDEIHPTCALDGYTDSICTKCGEERRFTLHRIPHTDADRDEYCDSCEKRLAVDSDMQKVSSLNDGMHVILYHSYSKLAVSDNYYIYHKLAGAEAYVKSGTLDFTPDCCGFTVIATDGGSYLTHNGMYLTCDEKGNSLYFTYEPTEYSIWYCEQSSYNGRVIIKNRNAAYNGTPQALEYYNGNFTTYSVKDNSAFQFEVYQTDSHFYSDAGYSWSDDLLTVTASAYCMLDPAHKACETVSTEYTLTKAPGDFEEGEAVFSADFSNPLFSHQEKIITLPESDENYKGYPDVIKGAWFYESVRYSTIKGFISGYSNGYFGPADEIQRQDFVVILARIAKADLESYKDKTCRLKDVQNGCYYSESIKWAVDNGIIKGYENGYFGVGDKITREQAAVILYRFIGSPDVSADSGILDCFSDRNKISSFAETAMIWAVKNSVITGRNETILAPVLTASRAEIATVIMRTDKNGIFTAKQSTSTANGYTTRISVFCFDILTFH